MPPDPAQAIRSVVAAVESGKLSRARIDESATRVLAAKIRVGLIKAKLVDLENVSDVLQSPEAEINVQQMSDRAVTLVRNERGAVPVAASNPCLVIVTTSRISQYGQRMAVDFRARAKGGRVTFVDASMPLSALIADVGDTGSQLVDFDGRCFQRRGAGRGFAGIIAEIVGGFHAFGADWRWGVRVMCWGMFRKVTAFLTTLSPTSPSELSAMKALFGGDRDQRAAAGDDPGARAGWRRNSVAGCETLRIYD